MLDQFSKQKKKRINKENEKRVRVVRQKMGQLLKLWPLSRR